MIELVELPLVLLLIAAYSAPEYAVKALPGTLVCVTLLLALPRYPLLRRVAISAAAAGLLSPYLVGGHSPVFLPLPFGVHLANRMGFSSIAPQAGLSAVATFVFVFIVLSRLLAPPKDAKDESPTQLPPRPSGGARRK